MFSLENKVQEFCEGLGLFQALKERKCPALVAVSGGVDSMVMLSLLHRLGLPLRVAVCDFGLRPEARDEVALVRRTAEGMGIPFHTRRFDTEGFASDEDMGIQAAARRLRYDWFRQLQAELGEEGSPLLLGHHQDDHKETLLLNLFRFKRTHIIEGIAPSDGWIFRPLWALSKAEIRDFALANGIAFLEDASNAGDQYLRNQIRHQLIPVLRQINPAWEVQLSNLEERYRMQWRSLERVRKEMDALRRMEGDAIFFPLQMAGEYPESWEDYLHHFLERYGFSHVERTSAHALTYAQPGRHVVSALGGWRITRLHDSLELRKEGWEPAPEVLWQGEEPQAFEVGSAKVSFDLLSATGLQDLSATPNVFMLDANKVNFPIRIRGWREGDRMQPLGMKGHKKISDIFVDQHMSAHQKQTALVFEDAKQVICLSRFRISEAVKVDQGTTRILRIAVTGHGYAD